MADMRAAAPGQLALGSLELRAADDRRMVVVQIDRLLLSAVAHLFVRQEIRRAGLFLQQVSAVFFVAEQPQHHCRRPCVSLCRGCGNAFFGQAARDHMRPPPLFEEQAVNPAHHLGLLLLHGQHAVCQPVAIRRGRAEYHAALHRPPLSPLDALGSLAALLLRHARHDGQPEFPFPGARVDIVG